MIRGAMIRGTMILRFTLLFAAGVCSASAYAVDFPVKVHDRSGLLSGAEVSVEITGGATPFRMVVKDDGQDPDVVSGDRLYTGKAVGVELQSGKVTVSAKGQSWTGDFMFDPGSDPVILVGLEGPGKAGVSTHEVMFFPDQKHGGPGGAPPPGGTGPGAPPPGGSGPPPGTSGAPGGQPPERTRSTPDGLWLGWGLLLGAGVGLGGLAWRGSQRRPQIPTLQATGSLTGDAEIRRDTTSIRGPHAPFDGVEVWVGPEEPGAPRGLWLGDGRWTPEEIVLALSVVLAQGRPVRVVVKEAWRVEAKDGFTALSQALRGRADLLWVEAG